MIVPRRSQAALFGHQPAPYHIHGLVSRCTASRTSARIALLQIDHAAARIEPDDERGTIEAIPDHRAREQGVALPVGHRNRRGVEDDPLLPGRFDRSRVDRLEVQIASEHRDREVVPRSASDRPHPTSTPPDGRRRRNSRRSRPILQSRRSGRNGASAAGV